jgi:hypothetical protein
MFIRHIPVSTPCGAAFAVQIVFPADLSMLAITLTAPPHCSQVSKDRGSSYLINETLNLQGQVH